MIISSALKIVTLLFSSLEFWVSLYGFYHIDFHSFPEVGINECQWRSSQNSSEQPQQQK